MPRRFDPLPIGLALLAFGVATAAVTFLSLSEPDVTYARAQWTALAALLVAAPALVIYVAGKGAPGGWWRAFWTAGLLTYLCHFWWVIFRSYQGNFAGVITHQGFPGVSNYAVTVVWIIDVVVAWTPFAAKAAVLRAVTWAWVTVSFLSAAVIFRTGTIREIGIILAAAIILAFLVRVFDFRAAPAGLAADGVAPRP